MKIIPNKYIEEKDIEKYLSFISNESWNCSLVFLRRLAAFARDNGHNMTSIIGRRSSVKQQQLWDSDLKKHNGVPSGKVAKPLTSWHEMGCTVDLDGGYWQAYSNKHWIPYSRLNQELNKYGLMLPLNKIDSPKVLEWWHLQPIETNGIASDKRKSFLDKDDVIYDKQEIDILNKVDEVISMLYDDDSAISKWANKAVYNMKDKGIMLGSDNKFNPKGEVTREQLAQVIYNVLKYLGK